MIHTFTKTIRTIQLHLKPRAAQTAPFQMLATNQYFNDNNQMLPTNKNKISPFQYQIQIVETKVIIIGFFDVVVYHSFSANMHYLFWQNTPQIKTIYISAIIFNQFNTNIC